jgi:hypothetical protein
MAIARCTAAGFALMLLLMPAAAAGQEEARPLFLQAGYGFGWPGEGAGPAGYIGGSLGSWKVRWVGASEIDLDFFSESDPEVRWDAGILRVWRWPWTVGFTSVGFGLAATAGRDLDRRVAGDDAEYLTVGVPLEASGAIASRRLGLGLTVFGNLNTEGSFGGAVLTVLAGRMPQP